jgi:DNA-binding response OmpR family regulator
MNKKVLLVDDDPMIRENIAAKLISEGFDVQQLTDGDEVMPMLKNFTPDVIMLDLMMKRMGGIECMKQMDKATLCKVIVMTNSKSEANMTHVLDMGVNTYISKSDKSLDTILRIVEQKVKQLCF